MNVEGVIREGEAYTADEFMHRLRWKEDAMRKAKKRGLKVHVDSRRRVVIGDEAIEYFRSCPVEG